MLNLTRSATSALRRSQACFIGPSLGRFAAAPRSSAPFSSATPKDTATKVSSYSEAAESGFDARPEEDRRVTAKGVTSSALELAKFGFPLLLALTLIFAFLPENESPASRRYREMRMQAEKEKQAKAEAAGSPQAGTAEGAAARPQEKPLR